MSRVAGAVSRIASGLVATPLHPQWLLGSDSATARWVASNARGRVLDIGCADRWVENKLADGCEYIGLDFPMTGKNLYGASPDIFADAAGLPIVDAAVDTVIMLEVLEHLRSPQAAWSEIVRVLRPRGVLLLSVPFVYPIHDAPHDYQRLTRYGLVRDAEAAGLKIETVSARLGAAESAGLMACLALGGLALESVKRRHAGMVLMPLIVSAIPVINLLAWMVGRLLPSWDAITNGYQLTARKP